MDAYAIIKTGSKQYRVQTGDVIDVELLEGGDKNTVEFNEVLFIHDGKKGKVGSPIVARSLVRGEIMDQVKGPKVIAYKYRKRKNYQRKVGHRQTYTRIKILELVGA